MELAERYLAIESLRLGERLRVAWHKDEPLPWETPLPRLLLQPLVENAVLHGVARLPRGGTVDIAMGVERRGKYYEEAGVVGCGPREGALAVPEELGFE